MKRKKFDPLAEPRGQGDEMCQPCGGCDWCMSRYRYRRWALRARMLLRQAQRDLFTELSAIGDDEIKTNPNLQARQRLLRRITNHLRGP